MTPESWLAASSDPTCRESARNLSTPGSTSRVIAHLGLLVVAVLVTASNSLHAQSTWRGLKVEPERRCSPYDPDDYRYSQSVEDRIIADYGGVYGPYTGRWFSSQRETDIEHMVARSEAHDSGLCAADLATRHRFANDLLNLTLASPSVNRGQKIARDASEWMPEKTNAGLLCGWLRWGSSRASLYTGPKRTHWSGCCRLASQPQWSSAQAETFPGDPPSGPGVGRRVAQR